MSQFIQGNPMGSTGILTYSTSNGTTSQSRIVLLSDSTDNKCSGTIYSPSSTQAGSIPLVDCLNDTELQWGLQQAPACLFVYNGHGGCQLAANSTITQNNMFSLIDLQVADAVNKRAAAVNAVRVHVDNTSASVFRNSLIGLTVSLAVFIIGIVIFTWWRLSRRIDSRNSYFPGANRANGTNNGPHRKEGPKLEQAEIEKFQTLVWASAGGSPDKECTVCLEEYEDGQELRKLGCGHLFHKPCVDRWLSTRSAFCPLCRTNFKEEA